MSLLFYQKCLGVYLHYFVRDHRPFVGKLDPQATDAYLLATHHDKKDIDVESIRT
jgi:hypothetical protein